MAEIGQGHNSATYGQELCAEIETVLSDEHKKLFHFAKWHIEDYLLGTEGMKLEQEGAYMRFLMRLYQRGKPLPDDDRYMSTLMRLSIRVWKRIKDSLVAIGKIIVKRGCLTNARFERERQERAEQLRKQAEATRKQWERQRAEKAGNSEVSAKFEESLDEVSPKLSQNEGEKVNKNNDPPGGQPDITRELKKEEKEEDSVPNGTGAEAPEKTLREVIWDEGLGWLRTRTLVREEKLRPRVGRWISDYGEVAVMNALDAAQQKGAVDPMSYIDGCLRRQGSAKVNGITNLKPWELEEQQADRNTSDALENLKKKYANGFVTS
jgi:uncharacterized protein YdaU (DUF1376 family)